ncbi:MAG: tRNA (adenosine(37)-N6)-threonylcarbamoyltransferase complex dimerization subunit type 1 TsaB [Firmicutes bacterium]|nr:tRNA (adenosine(37)-N6)-threonylcarbamoyltransferase complex dimerization subunit type 1 TsaB [Bacillota bacterium]
MKDLVLAIETSGAYVSAALVRRKASGRAELLARADRRAPRGHAQRLLPAVADLFRAAGADPDDLGWVAVGVGPGSYTGLRVGIATALGLCAGDGPRPVAVPTLAAAAHGGGVRGRVAVVAEAGRGGLYVQAFEWRRGEPAPRARGEPARLSAEELEPWLRAAGAPPTVVAVGAQAAAPARACGARVRVRTHASARSVAELAIVSLEEEARGHGQALAVAPIYLRPAAAAPGTGAAAG